MLVKGAFCIVSPRWHSAIPYILIFSLALWSIFCNITLKLSLTTLDFGPDDDTQNCHGDLSKSRCIFCVKNQCPNAKVEIYYASNHTAVNIYVIPSTCHICLHEWCLRYTTGSLFRLTTATSVAFFGHDMQGSLAYAKWCVIIFDTKGPFFKHGSTSIREWLCNYTHYKVWEWIMSDFISQCTGYLIAYLCCDESR